MTKVKTILAEFCSPKEILAINRLGLIKKEERESQPIPWRHRLPIAERRQLVMSEMRSSIRPAYRLTSRDKTKAVSTAKSPKDSKMGECLLNINIRGDPTLGSHLGRISREQRRLEHSHQQTRHTFIRKSQTLNHEPMILVERPPSPNVRTRAMLMNRHGVDPDTALLPHYMQPLHTRNKTPSTLTTIEAFTVETKKKRNVWEEVLDEKEAPKFKSMARPSARLTNHEISQLRIGHSLHKPTPESIAAVRAESAKEKPVTRPPSSVGTDGGPSVFITQMQLKDLPKTADGRLDRSVSLSDVTQEKKDEKLSTSSKGRESPASNKGRDSPPVAPVDRPLSHGAEKTSESTKVPGGGKEKKVTMKDETKDKVSRPINLVAPAGRERSEKKLKDFLSVLLEEPSEG